MGWPDYYPANCPPTDAQAVTRRVLRFVEYDPPRPEDFVPLLLSGRSFDESKSCEAAGLSVFTDPADIATQRRRFKPFRRRNVAEAMLQPEHGLTKPTPTKHLASHVTWWVDSAIDPVTLFTVMEGPENQP